MTSLQGLLFFVKATVLFFMLCAYPINLFPSTGSASSSEEKTTHSSSITESRGRYNAAGPGSAFEMLRSWRGYFEQQRRPCQSSWGRSFTLVISMLLLFDIPIHNYACFQENVENDRQGSKCSYLEYQGTWRFFYEILKSFQKVDPSIPVSCL